MNQLIKDCLTDIDKNASASSPATKSLFEIASASPLLSKKESDTFH